MSTTTTDFNGVTNACCALIMRSIPMDEQAVSKRKPTGVLDALLSAENRGGYTKLDLSEKDRPTDDINGSMSIGTEPSFRRVYTEGIIPICDQDTEPDDLCANPSTTEAVPATSYAYQSHTIDMGIKRELVLDLKGFKKFCKNPEQFIGDFIAANKFGVIQEMNKKLIPKIVSMMGEYSDGHDSVALPHTLNVINPTSTGDKINTLAFAKIVQEYEKIGAGQNPIMVGGSLLSLADFAKKYFTGQDNSGQEFGLIPSLYHDYATDTYFNDAFHHLLTWAPGTFQVETYNDINDDIIKNSIPGTERSRILSPFGDGFEWDLYVDRTNNGCRYVIKWQLWYDAIQPVVYSDCITKPALHWIIGCGANTCDLLNA